MQLNMAMARILTDAASIIAGDVADLGCSDPYHQRIDYRAIIAPLCPSTVAPPALALCPSCSGPGSTVRITAYDFVLPTGADFNREEFDGR